MSNILLLLGAAAVVVLPQPMVAAVGQEALSLERHQCRRVLIALLLGLVVMAVLGETTKAVTVRIHPLLDLPQLVAAVEVEVKQILAVCRAVPAEAEESRTVLVDQEHLVKEMLAVMAVKQETNLLAAAERVLLEHAQQEVQDLP